MNFKTMVREARKMIMKHFLPLITTILLISCGLNVTRSDMQYTAKYNASVQANRLYEVARSARGYNASAAYYISVANQINWFTSNDSLRSNKMYRQDTLLRKWWLEAWSYHRSRGTLSISEINSNQLYIAGLFAPVLNSEK